ncbi:hypothetical protein ACFL5O_12285, partial [Myxococcota bacterium]
MSPWAGRLNDDLRLPLSLLVDPRGEPNRMSEHLNRPKAAHLNLMGLATATCIVVANMVGTGVFTSLG